MKNVFWGGGGNMENERGMSGRLARAEKGEKEVGKKIPLFCSEGSKGAAL